MSSTEKNKCASNISAGDDDSSGDDDARVADMTFLSFIMAIYAEQAREKVREEKRSRTDKPSSSSSQTNEKRFRSNRISYLEQKKRH